MSYETYEVTVAQGRPIRLYLFERNEAVYWAYTNADREMSISGYQYRTEAIEDDGFKQSGEPNNDALKITVPISNDIAKMFKTYHPSEEITLTVRELDWSDPAQSIIVWVGSIANVTLMIEGVAEVTCTTFDASLERNLLKHTYTQKCRYALYGYDCGVNKEAYSVQGTITELDGASFVCSMSTQPKASLNYGFIQWKVLNGRATETRGIEFVKDGRVYLLGGTAGLKVGTPIVLYSGCDKGSQMCEQVFHNFNNYGGFRRLPGRSPFDGTQIM